MTRQPDARPGRRASGRPRGLTAGRLARPVRDLAVAVVALVWLGAHTRTRGLGYVGATGLVLFVVSTGAQLTRVEAGRRPSSSLVGWPLGLVVAGLAALAIPMLSRRPDPDAR